MKTQVERWIDRLRKAAGAKGSADADVDEGFTPSITVEDLTSIDFGFLGRVRYATAAVNLLAVAAQFGTFQIRNNPGSGLISVIDLIWVGGVAPASFNVGHIDAGTFIAGLGNVNPVPRDMRWQPTLGAASGVIYEAGNTATALPNQVHGSYSFTTLTGVIPLQFVLVPNFKGIIIQNNTANQASTFNIQVHERVFDPAELV